MTEQSKPAFDVYQAAGKRAWKQVDRDELWKALTKHASPDALRYNICGVRVLDGSALATDGKRLLVVNDIARGTSNAIYAVTCVRVTLELVSGEFPDINALFSDHVMAQKPQRFTLKNFGKLRKINAETPVRLTSDGFLIGSGPCEGIALNLRYLTQLPFTDEELTVDVRGNTDPVIVRPTLGGWLAVVMPVRIEAKDSFLREVANG